MLSRMRWARIFHLWAHRSLLSRTTVHWIIFPPNVWISGLISYRNSLESLLSCIKSHKRNVETTTESAFILGSPVTFHHYLMQTSIVILDVLVVERLDTLRSPFGDLLRQRRLEKCETSKKRKTTLRPVPRNRSNHDSILTEIFENA